MLLCPMLLNEINSIYVFGLRVDEPLVALTDLAVSAVCLYAFLKLGNKASDNKATRFYRYYFLLLTLATIAGGLLGHAFQYRLNAYWKLPGWILSMFGIMFIERAAINHTRLIFPKKAIEVLQVINILELIFFLSITLISLNFDFVQIHSAYGLLIVVAGLEGFLYYKTRNKASRNLLIGVLLASLAALVFMNQWSPHQWFNALALSHVIMCFSAGFFYRGAKYIIMA